MVDADDEIGKLRVKRKARGPQGGGGPWAHDVTKK